MPLGIAQSGVSISTAQRLFPQWRPSHASLQCRCNLRDL